MYFFFFKQKTAYEMRISDWSSDVCSSDLPRWSWCEAKSHVDRDHPSTMIRFPLLRVAEALVVDDFRRHELVGSEPRSLKARRAGDRFGMSPQPDPPPLALPGEVARDITEQQLAPLGHGLADGDNLKIVKATCRERGC